MPRASSKTASLNTSNSKEYLSNGITINPAVPSAGEKVKVIYDGLLSKSGANDVFARIGFNSSWENMSDYKMNKSNTGFEVTIPVIDADTMNLCFKDSANNWDNNSGRNYSFDITQ